MQKAVQKSKSGKKGTHFYKEAITRTKAAMSKGVLKGVLWHQGEGNASEPEKYMDQLKALISDLRNDLESPDLAFVAGQIVGDEKINDVIASLPKVVPHTGVASSKGLKAFDRWHFDSDSMKLLGERYAEQILEIHEMQDKVQTPVDSLATRKNFFLKDHRAFVMIPESASKSDPIPWVWYAPTLGNNLPGSAEKWMFDKFHKAGIAIAGIDVGESFGSPKGRKTYQEFYEHVRAEYEFSKKPVLLARSRGGLMLYSWACEHPKSVAGIAGIYPVCNIASYPGVNRAASAFQMSGEELQKVLSGT